MEDVIKTILAIVFIFTIGIWVGIDVTFEIMKIEEIQEIKPVDNGYYITINNEIYYKEV